MTGTTARRHKHTFAERANDLYETFPGAVHALMRVEQLPKTIWEPACGPGAIVRVLRTAGFKVIATDLVEYGCEDSASRIDFLHGVVGPAGRQAIVTNPPLSSPKNLRCTRFRCARTLPAAALAFLESEGRRRFLRVDRSPGCMFSETGCP